jgi:hypothetical protein
MAAVSRLAWGILGLGLTGALANVFLPQANVWGLNIGSLGATVFGFTLWTGAWLFARYPERIFSPDWSVAERRAWTALVFIGLIFLSCGSCGNCARCPTCRQESGSCRRITSSGT